MKKLKCFFAVALLSFQPNQVFTKNLNIINPTTLVDKLEIVEPAFIYPEVYSKIRYEQLRLTTINLIQTYAILLEKQDKTPTKKFEFYIEIVSDLLRKIDEQITEIIDMFLARGDGKNPQDPNDQSANIINTQSAVQAHQQSVISNLLATVEQSNHAISQLSNRNRWKKIKIIIGLAIAAVVISGFVIAGAYVYRKVNSIFEDDFEKLDKKIDEADELLLKTQELTAEAIGETKNGLSDINAKIRDAEMRLEEMVSEQINPLSNKLNKAIKESQFFMLHKKEHDEISDKYEEIRTELNRIGGIVGAQRSKKEILLNGVSRLTLQLKRIEKKLNKVEGKKHKRASSIFEKDGYGSS